MSASHTPTDAVPAHALRRGTRGFAAIVLFLTGMIVFAVTAFVLPSIALPGTLLTTLILLGIYLIDARDRNDAIQVASRIPAARVGSIEVRPVWDLRRHEPRAQSR